ncbi:hypothetical protein HDU96_001791, partial [Phlyctochytrium bullatum]
MANTFVDVAVLSIPPLIWLFSLKYVKDPEQHSCAYISPKDRAFKKFIRNLGPELVAAATKRLVAAAFAICDYTLVHLWRNQSKSETAAPPPKKTPIPSPEKTTNPKEPLRSAQSPTSTDQSPQFKSIGGHRWGSVGYAIRDLNKVERDLNEKYKTQLMNAGMERAKYFQQKCDRSRPDPTAIHASSSRTSPQSSWQPARLTTPPKAINSFKLSYPPLDPPARDEPVQQRGMPKKWPAMQKRFDHDQPLNEDPYRRRQQREQEDLRRLREAFARPIKILPQLATAEPERAEEILRLRRSPPEALAQKAEIEEFNNAIKKRTSRRKNKNVIQNDDVEVKAAASNDQAVPVLQVFVVDVDAQAKEIPSSPTWLTNNATPAASTSTDLREEIASPSSVESTSSPTDSAITLNAPETITATALQPSESGTAGPPIDNNILDNHPLDSSTIQTAETVESVQPLENHQADFASAESVDPVNSAPSEHAPLESPQVESVPPSNTPSAEFASVESVEPVNHAPPPSTPLESPQSPQVETAPDAPVAETGSVAASVSPDAQGVPEPAPIFFPTDNAELPSTIPTESPVEILQAEIEPSPPASPVTDS